MANKSSSFLMRETASHVKWCLNKKISARTIRIYLKQQKDRHGITKHNLKKFYKEQYGEELILGR